jgi:hypothetical protein
MVTRMATVLAVVLLLAGASAPAALADGDPASDTLLGENVFYPYQPPVPGSIQMRLNAETAAAKQAGFPIKVALIGSPTDLGVIPDLFNKPQQYADFLDQEISFQGKQQLLVVMPDGYGTQGLPAAATAAAAHLSPPAIKSPTGLAQAAIHTVAKLSAAAGHPLSGESGAAGSASGGGSNAGLAIGLGVAAVIVASALIVVRRRQPVG